MTLLAVMACSSTVSVGRLAGPEPTGEEVMPHDPALAMHRGNAQRTAEYPCHLPTPPEQRWQLQLSGSSLSPSASGRYLGYGSRDGYQLLDPASGTVLHHWETPRRSALSEMAFDGERVFVGLGYDFVAFGLEPDEELWRWTEVRSNIARPLIYRDAVYVNGQESPPEDDGVMMKFDMKGKLQWDVRFPHEESRWTIDIGGMAALDERLFVSVRDSLYALDLDSGTVLWSTALTANYLSMPIVASEHGIVFTRGQFVYALQAETGVVLWSVRVEGLPVPYMAYSDGLLFMGTEEGLMRALDAQTGAEVWRHQGREFPQSPIVAGDLVLYAELYTKLIHARDKYSGEWRWTVSLGEHGARELACYGDMLFAGGHTLQGLQSL
ncbi:MAG: PQQ-binding-like beta-propeller repeat protein [Myxococcota bacterium]|nr:PQQ-binding-like beta-propeller repeat protein [Myxococcota bacterium]